MNLLKHIKILRTVPTDAHNLGSQSLKLLLVLTKLRSLHRASRSASLCDRLYIQKSKGMNIHRRDTMICYQFKHGSICSKKSIFCIHKQSIALLLQRLAAAFVASSKEQVMQCLTAGRGACEALDKAVCEVSVNTAYACQIRYKGSLNAQVTLGKKKATRASLPIRLSSDSFLPSDPESSLQQQ